MSQPVVLVVFYSRCGSTEKLALAAAVGAVQARALIRLRRLPDAGKNPSLTSDFSISNKETLTGNREITSQTGILSSEETLRRMHREYVAPTESDVVGADALILAAPAGFMTSSPEWSDHMDLLARLASAAKLKLKVVGVVDSESETTYMSFSDAITQMGLRTSPRTSGSTGALERATALGRQTAQEAAK